MKKISLIICGIVVLLAIVAGAVFVACTKDVPDKSQPTDDVVLTLEGTWKVVAYSNAPMTNVFSYIDNQYLVFEEGGALSYYVGGTKAVSAKYGYDGGKVEYKANSTASFHKGTLRLSDADSDNLPSSLQVQRYTDSVIYLVDESASPREWVIVKVDGSKDDYKQVNSAYLQRDWLVELKGRDLSDMAFAVKETSIEVSGSMQTTLGCSWNEASQVVEITGIGTAHVFAPQEGILLLVVEENATFIVVWQLKLKA